MIFLLIWRNVIIPLPWGEEMGGVRVNGLMGGIWEGAGVSGDLGDGISHNHEMFIDKTLISFKTKIFNCLW